MTAYEKLVHHYLANRGYREGKTRVAVDTIASELNLNRKTVIAATTTLDRLEFVKKDSRNRRKTVYRINRESVPPSGTNQSVPPQGINTVSDPQSVPPDGTRSKKEKRNMNAFPKDFRVTEEIRKWAKEKGFRNPNQLLESFRDYHLSKGSLFSDWNAAFRTWIRNDLKFNAGQQDRKRELVM